MACWLALEGDPAFNLSENLLQMFFPCLPLLLHPPHSDNSGFRGTGKGGDSQIKGEPEKQDCLQGSRGGMQSTGSQDRSTTKDIPSTAGQPSTLNATLAATKRF